ncbi:hypothetical protein QPL65_25485, partial [Escherichia coli]|uniref:hypothetical protein n=1 Tax=Escherichia coli TaxID=562 RepID=UPI00270589B4
NIMAGFFIPDEKNIDSLFKEASKKNIKEEKSINESTEADNKEESIKKAEDDNKKTADSGNEKEKGNVNTTNPKSEMMNK